MTTSTLRWFALGRFPLAIAAAWYLNDLGELRGKQELYTQQSPQRLKALRESALIESAVSSNRIEGVTVDPARVRDLLAAPRPLFRDRDEEEVRGYRDALAWLHKDASVLPITNATVRQLHAMTRGQIWDARQIQESGRRHHRALPGWPGTGPFPPRPAGRDPGRHGGPGR